ncbi:MAG: hypothetical protein IJV96_07605 [Clostridia bacterium]|nr:hypothetical protein [Clostridia bacterium]
MKPIFGINVTKNKKNEEYNGKEFLVQALSAEVQAALDHTDESIETLEKNTSLPLVWRIVKWIAGVMALILLGGFFRGLADGDITLAQAYDNAPAVFWIFGAALVIFGVLFMTERGMQKDAETSGEVAKVAHVAETAANRMFDELGVPSGAVETDVFLFFYREKDGKIKTWTKGMQLFEYFSLVVKAFADEENLYFARADGKFAFPLASCVGIRTVNKRCMISEWNKEISFDEGEYKKYKLTMNQYGCVICRAYHILELMHEGETYGIYFPSYELPVIEALTGLRAAEGEGQPVAEENGTEA